MLLIKFKGEFGDIFKFRYYREAAALLSGLKMRNMSNTERVKLS
jgi:hypothetical protein